MFAICLLLCAAQVQDDPVANLNHKDPEVRRAGAIIIGAKEIARGILPLIELLKDEGNLEVRSAATDALRRITGQTLDATYAAWRAWWDREGKDRVSNQLVFTSDQADQVMQPFRDELKHKLEKGLAEIEKTRTENRFVSYITGGVSIFFFLIMVYFVSLVSSRLKEWKVVVARAEEYVHKSEEITKRTDRITSELDAKKAEILEFFGKAKEDGQGEVERYSDMLQQNLEHKLREEMMALRQKAEKEIEQTLGEMRAQVEVEIRRGANDQREKNDKAFQEQRERFLKDVGAQSLFLEASFHSLNRRHEEALRRFKQLVQMKPDHPLAWTNIGNACRELSRFDEALEAYHKALELTPNSATILYNVAATYARMKKKDKMLESLTLTIANDGEFKDEALNDPAFRDFWNDPAFKDIAEG